VCLPPSGKYREARLRDDLRLSAWRIGLQVDAKPLTKGVDLVKDRIARVVTGVIGRLILGGLPRLIEKGVADVEKDGPNNHGQRWTMERETRLELATPTLGRSYSTN
jgi:hypothetical protein